MKPVADPDQEELLRILESHGQQFLGSFDSNTLKGKRRDTAGPSVGPSRKRAKIEHNSEEANDSEGSDEWHGFGEENDSQSDDALETDDEDRVYDAEDVSPRTSGVPDVIVFSENSGSSSTSTQPTKAQMKAFMSSKVEKLRKDISPEEEEIGEDNGDDEMQVSLS
ncbi:hypothetical protein QCA50_001302 [Cerrena zonata]|uniref:Uncharacterized protein n=1 Tax=Cerrena zonata TaxID=2478898 RepID=A0AAW0GWJ9_9APHY